MKHCCRTEKSSGYKERMRRGAELAAALPQLMSQSEVAAQLGISQQAVSLAERSALAKIREALIKAANEMRPA